MELKKLRLGSLSKDDWMEFGKMALAIIGFLAIIQWIMVPRRNHCDDLNRIRVEVDAMDKAISLFDDGKTPLSDAVNQTSVQIRSLQAVVEKSQCSDDWISR